MAKKWLLILNERSGGATEDVRPAIESAIAAAGDLFEDLTIEEGHSVGECLAATTQPYDRILIAGGDGTVMEAVNGLMHRGVDVPLSIIPTGTANLVARALEIPTDREDAMAVALGDESVRLDVGKCGDRYFALGVGLGLAERFVTSAEEGEKRRLGPAAYILSLIREIQAPRIRFEVAVDEKPATEYRGVALVVANTAGIGDGRKFSDEVKGSDGQLNLVVLHHIGWLSAMRLAWRALFGELTHDPEVTHIPFQTARIASRPEVPIQIDGDPVRQTTPLDIAVFHKKLTVTRKVRAK